MTTIKLVFSVAALCVPLAALSVPAVAATAHNLQTGAHTSNAADTAETAYLKQVQANHAPYANVGRLSDTSER